MNNVPNKPLARSLNTTERHRIHGPGLILARIVWLAIILVSIVFYLLSIPDLGEAYVEAELIAALERSQFAVSPSVIGVHLTVVTTLTTVFFIVVAIALFVYRSDDRMVLFTSIMLATFGTFVVSGLPFTIGERFPEWLWLMQIMSTIGYSTFIIFLYTLPDGRFIPRWGAVVAAFGAVLMGVFSFYGDEMRGIMGDAVFFSLIFIVYALSIPANQARMKNASLAQHQQVKWIMLGLMAALFGFGVGTFPRIILDNLLDTWGILAVALIILGQTIMILTLALVPIGIGASIARYRLWDIDFLINRSLIYGTLTGLLALFFGGILFGVQVIYQAITGSPQVPVVAIIIAVVGVAGAFEPARIRLRRLVDRHLYGIELDYEGALRKYAAHGRTIQAQIDTQTSFGDYSNLQLLGRGGMGEVYRAQQPTTGQTVAIKMLPEHMSSDEARRRFNREAQTIATLDHPNIVTLYDFGEHHGTPYMVMQYVSGQNLSDLLNARGKLSLDEALPLLQDIANALDHAHTQGIIHRDIKPSNVMLQPVTPANGRPFQAILMDFGIARLASAVTQLTGTGGMVGTLDYIAPEQIQGASEVDARADIYALGIMTYQMLTGQLPFRHSNPGAMIMAHLMEPPPDPLEIIPDLPELAAEAITQAMAKKPAERFASAGEMLAQMVG